MLKRTLYALAVMVGIGFAPIAAQGFEWGLEVGDLGDEIKPRHTLSWVGDEWLGTLKPVLTAGTFVVEFEDGDRYDQVYALVGLRGEVNRFFGQAQIGWDAEYWATMDAETSDEGAMTTPGAIVSGAIGAKIVGPLGIIGRGLFDLRGGFSLLGYSIGGALSL